MPDIEEGSEYTRNVQIISKLLNHHDEFQEAMNRRVQIAASGKKIDQSMMNPVMAEKVQEVIKQLDEANMQSQTYIANQKLLKSNLIDGWLKKHVNKVDNDKASAENADKKEVPTHSMKEMDMAAEIFHVWDSKLRRYIMFEDFSSNLIGMGLAPDRNCVRKIMQALKGDNPNFPD